jgi:hypothetical protein
MPDRVKNEEALHRVKEERNFLPMGEGGKKRANWIGHILAKNCFFLVLLQKTHEGRKY